MTSDEYLKLFPLTVREKALTVALDIRKFEIELYWKRAAYFWTFIAAAFAGYFAIKDGEFGNLFVVTCLGFIFSLAWYFVNCGSGSWQRNWEAHVDLLENDIMGPLHKTLINRGSYNFWNLAEPFPFSPSRINNILAVSVTVVWSFLILRTLKKALPDFALPFSGTAIFMSGLTLIVSISLVCAGRARRSDDLISIKLRVRTFDTTHRQSVDWSLCRRIGSIWNNIKRRQVVPR